MHTESKHLLTALARFKNKVMPSQQSMQIDTAHAQICCVKKLRLQTLTMHRPNVFLHGVRCQQHSLRKKEEAGGDSWLMYILLQLLEESGGVTKQADVPQRSASRQGQQRFSSCPQATLSRLQSPQSSNPAFMVPGIAARKLCLIKGPSNEQVKRRRRTEDAWYLTSERRGQMQWRGEVQRVLRVKRVSQALNEERERETVCVGYWLWLTGWENCSVFRHGATHSQRESERTRETQWTYILNANRRSWKYVSGLEIVQLLTEIHLGQGVEVSYCNWLLWSTCYCPLLLLSVTAVTFTIQSLAPNLLPMASFQRAFW